MIDFSTLQDISIPEGVVTQITDASGRVLWAVSGGKVILEVEKITSNTYAGETTYTAEEFILLDIYPKTNGTVSVTYGGLTKTITDTSGAENPNAQQVFFGTFNGVSDSVATPASGELVIEGDYYVFGRSSFFLNNKAISSSVHCVRKIHNFGTIEDIPDQMLTKMLTGGGGLVGELIIPATIKTVGDGAFSFNDGITNVVIKSGNTRIGSDSFLHTSNSSNWQVMVLSKVPPKLTVEEETGKSTAFGTDHEMFLFPERIIVPKGCVNTYKTAEGWSTYADLIVEAS